jgi:hypothetical protein
VSSLILSCAGLALSILRGALDIRRIVVGKAMWRQFDHEAMAPLADEEGS